MQKILPHLWFDKEAKEAAEFYCAVFPNSTVDTVRVLKDTPSGDADTVKFTLNGYSFMAISAGPYFQLNPSISFMVNFDPSKDEKAEANLEEIWNKLIEGGQALMPLQEYPFSKKYGWVQDKFGVTWQLMLTDPSGDERPYIIPSIMYVGENAGRAEEATDYYISVFKNSKRGIIARYPEGGESPDKPGTVMFTDFQLENQWFVAMDSAMDHKFSFSEAISLLVQCESQEEIDEYWAQLSADEKSEQCGWLRDKYGLSWQISSVRLDEMMSSGSEEQIHRVTQAFLKMKKFDLAKLEEAFNQK